MSGGLPGVFPARRTGAGVAEGSRTAGPPTPSPGQGFLSPCAVTEGVCDISSWAHIPVCL